MSQTPIGQKTSLKIGELLVKEGYLSQKDLLVALDLQKRDAAEAALPLGELLLKKNLITAEQLHTLLQHPDLRKPIGMVLVEEGVITPDQLGACLKEQRAGVPIGQLMIRKGLVKREDLEDFLKRQAEGIRIGELAHRINMVSQRDVAKLLAIKSMHRTLGEVLCDIGLVQPNDLNHILKKYNKQLRLGEILIRQGVLSESQFQAAFQEQGQTHAPLGSILLKKDIITNDQLYTALSRQYNIVYRDLEDFSFDDKQKRMLMRIVGERYAQKHQVLPLSIKQDKLLIGVCHPHTLQSVQDLKPMYAHLSMQPVLISEEKFSDLFRALYGKAAAGAVKSEAQLGVSGEDLVEIDLKETEIEKGRANLYGGTDMMAEQVVDYIIKYGIINGASDIHLEQDREGTHLRYRLDGVCQEPKIEWLRQKLKEMPGAVVSRIKVMSNLDIAEKRLPQDGVFRVNYYDRGSDKRFDLDFRVATCPAIVGENITIRILDSRKAKVGLENLNHSEHVLTPLKRLFMSSAGMILVSGPTGSGKSSTLYGALQYIYNPGIKIITAEDPIEYSFPGIMQTQIKPKINLTFARLLRSFLRLDPDVILVGEIRDEETASIGFDAAQTGHLLLSTIHTNDAVSSISRLLDLNIEHNQIASCLIGVLAQRLVRRNCRKCTREYTPQRSEWRMFFHTYPEHLKFFRGIGCKACGFTGYSGRTLISELLEINRDIALALSTGANENQIKQLALDGGMKTMIDDGLLKLDQTNLAEIVRVVPIEMIKEFRARKMDSSADGAALDPKAAPHDRFGFRREAKVMISDPEADWLLIDKFFERYEGLKQKIGQSQEATDANLFRAFVTDNHRRISQQFQCQSVTFFLTVQNGKVEIAASASRQGAL
jgi:type IV pilus assembly protein PilB